MRRYASIWLPDWPIAQANRRRQKAAPCKLSDEELAHPFALVTPAQGGIRIVAVNQAARQAGIRHNHLLADARTLCPDLHVTDHDPDADNADLAQLALWCLRFTPLTAPDLPDGLLLDITGCAHLFGGEQGLKDEIENRLKRLGLRAHICFADTIGAAFAISRCGRQQHACVHLEETRKALSPLPMKALRIEPETERRLAQVGLTRIGDILDKPRAPLAARYGEGLVKRLDQALGQRGESFSPLAEPPDYRIHQSFPEPILILEQVQACLPPLVTPLMQTLQQDGLGARRFDLHLAEVDGAVKTLSVRTGALCQDREHLIRLLSERLDKLCETFETGFGIEQLTLCLFDTEPVQAHQRTLMSGRKGTAETEFQALLDRYGNRLGFDNIGRFIPIESHIPERSERLAPVTAKRKQDMLWPVFTRQVQGGDHLGRPILLLPTPEPIEAMAEVPDGPPLQFQWRRVSHRILKAEGPERIAPEWWGRSAANAEPTRDYYRIEDGEGRRFWVFRQGLYERDETPRWFMHGFFA